MQGEGFALVYSITAKSSFLETDELREQIVRSKGLETVPLVLVGNKIDLDDSRIVTKEEGAAQAARWNASFFESSAKTRLNVDAIFHELVRLIRKADPAMGHPTKPKACVVM